MSWRWWKIFFNPSTDLLETLNDMNNKLEEIQKSLDMYLETKRQIFPRFYFLSNDDLLEILGQSRNPEAVQPHLKKCFDNIVKLAMAKVASWIFLLWMKLIFTDKAKKGFLVLTVPYIIVCWCLPSKRTPNSFISPDGYGSEVGGIVDVFSRWWDDSFRRPHSSRRSGGSLAVRHREEHEADIERTA